MVVSPPGGPPDVEGTWNTNANRVTAGYFATMGIELSSGGVFGDEPASAAAFGNGQPPATPFGNGQPLAEAPTPTAVVVNAAFARRFFGAEDANGRVFDIGREFKKPTYRIVGVVADANYRSLREADPPIFYMNPLSQPQTNAGAFSLLLRTTTPEAVMAPVRSLVRSIDPALPVPARPRMSPCRVRSRACCTRSRRSTRSPWALGCCSAADGARGRDRAGPSRDLGRSSADAAGGSEAGSPQTTPAAATNATAPAI